ncbi:MAG TPA: histone deacetylase [Nocardioides sp.]|nr:histone deacetylase [Nocardioides sp.]
MESEPLPDDPEAEPLPEHGDVWYVSYGSNMSAGRLAAYLEGGRPPGGRRSNPGARNSTLPRRSVPVDLPGALYFAGESPQWGGGVAFYDHDAQEPGQGGPTAARAYLVTAEQFADVAAQEMYRVPQEGDPLEEVVLGGIDGGRHHVGPGRYETLVEVGRLDGAPMLLFTSPHGIDHVEHTQPAPTYLAMLELGLKESREWDDDEVAAYFERVGVVIDD